MHQQINKQIQIKLIIGCIILGYAHSLCVLSLVMIYSLNHYLSHTIALVHTVPL